jgi:hypothetical protein
MRATGETAGHVDPPPADTALDLDQVADVVAHLRAVLAQVDASRLNAASTRPDQLEAAAVALEAIRDEPAPIDLDRLE